MSQPASASNDHDDDNTDGSRGIRAVSEARRWLATLAHNGAADVQIKEPFQPAYGGMVIVQASLVREDGARVNVAVYCYDDTPPPAVVDWLPPLPEEHPGGWHRDERNFH